MVLHSDIIKLCLKAEPGKMGHVFTFANKVPFLKPWYSATFLHKAF